MHDRAQSVGLARYVLAFIAGAPVIWIVWTITGKILPGAKTATNSSQANQATTWIQQGIDFMPVFMLLVGFFGLIVLSVFQRELLR
jgi:hypothetical protein